MYKLRTPSKSFTVTHYPAVRRPSPDRLISGTLLKRDPVYPKKRGYPSPDLSSNHFIKVLNSKTPEKIYKGGPVRLFYILRQDRTQWRLPSIVASCGGLACSSCSFRDALRGRALRCLRCTRYPPKPQCLYELDCIFSPFPALQE